MGGNWVEGGQAPKSIQTESMRTSNHPCGQPMESASGFGRPARNTTDRAEIAWTFETSPSKSPSQHDSRVMPERRME